MIHSVFDKLSICYPEKQKIILHIDEHIPLILADSFLMKQVIVNIISNSLKFTRNEDVCIMTVGYKVENNEYIFYIKDNGVGFDLTFSENLFGMFQRMHSSDDFKCSGIGLAIVKKYSEIWRQCMDHKRSRKRSLCIFFYSPLKYSFNSIYSKILECGYYV